MTYSASLRGRVSVLKHRVDRPLL